MDKKIKSFCKSQNIKFRHNVSMASISCFKSGGMVKFLIYPSTKYQLKALVEMLDFNKISYHVIGATSNILFRSRININVLISTIKLNNIIISKSKRIIEAEAGAMMPTLVQEALKYNFGGFEGLAGIPGTIGGGIFMNAGAYGDEIKDLLINVKILDEKYKFKNLLKDELRFSWRHSLFQEKKLGIIVSAKFKGIKEKPERIKVKINKNRINRLTHQEFIHPNIGSLFATKDIYADLARFSLTYGLKLKFVKKIYKYTQPDNNILLNYITCKHFNIDYKNRVFSNKTMNCLVNKEFSTKQFLEYINKIKKITKNTVPLENIII